VWDAENDGSSQILEASPIQMWSNGDAWGLLIAAIVLFIFGSSLD
jgi:hypothetical protein